MKHNGIKSLLGVDHIDDFLDTYFDSKPYRSIRNNKKIFQHLNFDMDDILISYADSWGEIRLARYPEPDQSLVDSPPSGTILNMAYQSGHTIVVNDLQNKIKNIYHLCHEIESLFMGKSNCNAYITPAKSQGLDIHYDNQDIIILQLTGEKLWEYDNTSTRYPLDDDSYDNEYISNCTNLKTTQLTPGSVLYLPRGTAHRVRTGTSTHSIHLTVSITPFRYLHFIQNLFAIAAKDNIMLRKAISPKEAKLHLSGDDTSSLINLTNNILNTAIAKNDTTIINHTLLNIINNLLNNQHAKTGFSFEKLNHHQILDEHSLLRINQDQNIVFSHTDNKIYYIGGEITLDSNHMFMVDLLCKKDAFFVQDIKYRSNRKKIEMAQSLIDIGLVVLGNNENPIKPENTTRFECTICGYIYDESQEAILFNSLSKTWVCPNCMVETSFFKQI